MSLDAQRLPIVFVFFSHCCFQVVGADANYVISKFLLAQPPGAQRPRVAGRTHLSVKMIELLVSLIFIFEV
jgi:hypothetical protein